MDDPLIWSPEEQERALRTIAPWYDLDFGAVREDVTMLMELISPGERVLELGAGTGRIAVPLALNGCQVTAVDSSEAMLSVGRERMEDVGVCVMEGDMRRPLCGAGADRSEADSKGQFDVVVIGLSTFQHLLRRQDQMQVLATVSQHLHSGGRLVIDWTAPRPDDLEWSPPIMRQEWVRMSAEDELVTKSSCQELALDRECGDPIDRAQPIAWITYQYDAVAAGGDGGPVRRSMARFPLRVNLNVGEMAGLLELSNLRPIEWFGSWDLAPVGEGDRLIVVAESAS